MSKKTLLLAPVEWWWIFNHGDQGGILGLPGTDRYHYSQAKQGPKFNLPQRILIGNILLQQWTICSTNWLPLSFGKNKSWTFAFLLSLRLLVLFLEYSRGLGEEGLIRLRILWYPPPSHCSSSTIPRESGSLENPPLPSLGSLYPELTNEFLTLGLLRRWLLKIITLNRDLSGTLFRTDALAKKVQHKIICL